MINPDAAYKNALQYQFFACYCSQRFNFMPISSDRKKEFRTLGHKLNPIVTIAGNGLSESVLAELNRALDDHELIKVKLALVEREARKADQKSTRLNSSHVRISYAV